MIVSEQCFLSTAISMLREHLLTSIKPKEFSTEGACGAVNPDDAMIAAVSLSDYADKSLCGQKVRVTNTGPLPLPFDQQVTGEGNQIEVTIVDLCEGCKRTDIDLSRGAWSDLTDGYGDSRTSVSW